MIDVVAGVIIDQEGRILACQRPPGKHLAGKWEFPGGKIEPGESPQAALIRELQEELSVTVETSTALTPVIWDYGSGAICLHPYLCRIVAGEIYLTEHTAYRWITRERWRKPDWAEADVPIWEEFISR